MNKDGFMLYCSHYPALNILTLEEKGMLLDAIFLYQINGDILCTVPPAVIVAFSFMKQQFDRDAIKYENVIKKNTANGAKGGRPKKENPKNPPLFSESKDIPSDTKNTTGISGTPDNTGSETTPPPDEYTPPPSASDIPPKKVSVNKVTSPAFHPPTLQEVESYCNERKNNINAQLFIDYYTARGWMIGKNKMKDWRAAVRTWEGKQKEAKNKSQYIHPSCDYLNDKKHDSRF